MSIEEFIIQLIAEKHQGASVEEFMREDMKKDLTNRLTTFVSLKVMTELAEKNPKLLAQFQILASSNTSTKEVQRFIETNIPDGPAFLAKVFDDFRILYLGLNKS